MKMSARAKLTLLVATIVAAGSVATADGLGPQKLLDAVTPTSPATTPATAPAPATPTPPLTPTRLTALPAHSLSDGTQPLRVRISGVPAPGSPRPTISPTVAGTWSVNGESEIFTPTSTLKPCTSYNLNIPATTTATGHSGLGTHRTIPLQVACPSLRALQQGLARLDYLPYSFHSSFGVHIARGAETRSLAARHAFNPPHGRLLANVRSAPDLNYGELDPTTRGALTVFQSDHGLSPSGEPSPETWATLLAAETLGHDNPSPYTFVTVNEASPETLEVHRGNHVALSTPANTGVAGAETPHGIFPIFSRFVATTMVGTNPDGTKYNDPGVPWVNYFNGGDAVHGFPRASYGSPQSNGCVELPISTAEHVFHMLAIGDIVVVSG
jgi:peptidoglycan hydrolase-like protein with peptidoglycan-binding domain